MMQLSVSVSSASWATSLPAAPVLDKAVSAIVPAHVRRWTGIAPMIDQAALDQHFISIHLGGAKRLFRSGEGSLRTRDVANAAYSIIPAGAAFQWNTEGPVDFAHIYFDTSVVNHVITEAFDRDPASVSLQEQLGQDDPLIGPLALSLLDELNVEHGNQAYLDDLTHLLLCRTLRLHSDAPNSAGCAQYALAPFRLRRALDFIESNLSMPIGVAEIATASGISAYHFSRAFRQSTGRPPYSYLLERRTELAKLLLAQGDLTVAEVAQRCGFASLGQFSRMFRRGAGASPSQYRDRL